MAFTQRPLQNFRMFDHVLSDDKERRVNMMLSEDIKQLGGQFVAWPIIEGHGDEGPLHMHGAVANRWGYRS